jgi:lipopolysaccharide transport system ATP-binding protein
MNNSVIKVDGVSKKYCQTLRHTMSYGVKDLACSFLGISQQSEQLRPGEFWAVNDVSFEVKPGETVGIVGSNGSGKSTILKMLNGIFMPDMGRIEITGRVGALIEVGAGFHPMLTGRENIYVNGAIYGMGKNEINRKFDEIVDFSGIGEFIDLPVKHYSSGMYVRLGFAIAVFSDLDIMLIDEVLAVGDIAFQHRCYEKILEFKNNEKAIVLVTHDMDAVVRHCDHSILVNQGKLLKQGTPQSVVNRYRDLLDGHVSQDSSATTSNKEWRSIEICLQTNVSPIKQLLMNRSITDGCPLRNSYNSNEYRQGNGDASIIDYCVVSGNGFEIASINPGDPIDIYVKALFHTAVLRPVAGFSIKTLDGLNLYGYNNIYNGSYIPPIEPNTICVFRFSLTMPVQAGTYFFDVGLAENTESDSYRVFERRSSLFSLVVNNKQQADGLLFIDSTFQECSRQVSSDYSAEVKGIVA